MPTTIKDKEAKKRISWKAASLIRSQDTLALGPGAMAGDAFKVLIEGRGGAAAPSFVVTNSFLITGVDIPGSCHGIKVIGRTYNDKARAFIDEEVVTGFSDRGTQCNNVLVSVAGITSDDSRFVDFHCPPAETAVIRALMSHARSHLIVMCAYSSLGSAMLPRVCTLEDILKDLPERASVTLVTNHESEWEKLSQDENPNANLAIAAEMLKTLKAREKKFERFHLEFAKEEDVQEL